MQNEQLLIRVFLIKNLEIKYIQVDLKNLLAID